MGGPRAPWNEADLRARMDQYKAGGVSIINLMIGGFDDVIWGKPGADAQIEKFDFTVFNRELVGADYSRKTGPVYQMIWGRHMSAESAAAFSSLQTPASSANAAGTLSVLTAQTRRAKVARRSMDVLVQWFAVTAW